MPLPTNPEPPVTMTTYSASDMASEARALASVEVALDTKSPVRMVTCLLQLGLLLSIQILYSFGYWDASTLQMGVSTLPAFMDTMDLSLLYSTSVLEGSNLTIVNLLCSLCSLALLALLMKNDNEGTLLTTQPLQLLLLGDGDHVLSETEQRGRMGSPQEEGRGRMRRIGRHARSIIVSIRPTPILAIARLGLTQVEARCHQLTSI